MQRRLAGSTTPPIPQPVPTLAAGEQLGIWSCAKVASLANSALNSMFGTVNHSGSWVPAIANLAKGDSAQFQNILAGGLPGSIGQLVAAFIRYQGGGFSGLYSLNSVTLKALLLGLTLEPQFSIDGVIAQALVGEYGSERGNTALRTLKNAVIDAVSNAAGQQNQQVRVMLQANFGASGKICLD
jgi:hypothetical protein